MNVTEQSYFQSKFQTESPTMAPVTGVDNSDADKPLEFNIHGTISESHKKTGDNIVVTTTFEFSKKFFSKLFGLL